MAQRLFGLMWTSRKQSKECENKNWEKSTWWPEVRLVIPDWWDRAAERRLDINFLEKFKSLTRLSCFLSWSVVQHQAHRHSTYAGHREKLLPSILLHNQGARQQLLRRKVRRTDGVVMRTWNWRKSSAIVKYYVDQLDHDFSKLIKKSVNG